MHELEKRADQHRLEALRKISALTQEMQAGEDPSPEDKPTLTSRMVKKIERLRTRFSS